MLVAFLALGMVPCSGEDTSTIRYLYDSNESVKGDGFANSYSLLSADDLKLRNTAHGSGSYSVESVQHTRQFSERILSSNQAINSSDAEVRLNETVDAAYSETKIDLGGSFRVLPFRSQWSEDTRASNANDGAAMSSTFNYATSLKKQMGARLYYDSSTSEDEATSSYSAESRFSTRLNIAAEFSGSAHICAVQAYKGPKYSQVLVDEDYRGTFTIAKDMIIYGESIERSADEDWLPCCTGGWKSMDKHDKRGHGASAEGIFNCTCFKVPASAEFPSK